ncbi:MAG: hypothetical protein JSR21_05980 [Proteobacteria bacterium]|nr:hypothetical protein [Pseudomonadota bacterium]
MTTATASAPQSLPPPPHSGAAARAGGGARPGARPGAVVARWLARLVEIGNAISARVIERTGRRSAVAPDGTDPYAPEPAPDGSGKVSAAAWLAAGLAQRAVTHAINRIAALQARLEWEAALARRAARAASPEAQERHADALARRAEKRAAKLAELAAIGLDKRYMMLERPFGTPPPRRRGDAWLRKMSLIASIAGKPDGDVVTDACIALAGAARVNGDEATAQAVKRAGLAILSAMGDETAIRAVAARQARGAPPPEEAEAARDNAPPLWPWPPFDTG